MASKYDFYQVSSQERKELSTGIKTKKEAEKRMLLFIKEKAFLGKPVQLDEDVIVISDDGVKLEVYDASKMSKHKTKQEALDYRSELYDMQTPLEVAIVNKNLKFAISMIEMGANCTDPNPKTNVTPFELLKTTYSDEKVKTKEYYKCYELIEMMEKELEKEKKKSDMKKLLKVYKEGKDKERKIPDTKIGIVSSLKSHVPKYTSSSLGSSSKKGKEKTDKLFLDYQNRYSPLKKV